MFKDSQYLKCYFTEDELKDFAGELARATTELGEVRVQKKEITSEFAARIASLETKLGEMSRKITNGYEFREVECRVELNTPRAGRKQIYRTDTGELVKETIMADEELQRKLPLEPADDQGGDEAAAVQPAVVAAQKPKRGAAGEVTQ